MININRNLKNQKGISLVEIVIATAILVLVGVISLNFIFTTIEARKTSVKRLDALSIATSYMEEIKSEYRKEGIVPQLPSEVDRNNLRYSITTSEKSFNNNELVEIIVTVLSPGMEPITVITVLRRWKYDDKYFKN